MAKEQTPEAVPGAQNQSAKRQNLASNAVIHATAAVDAIRALAALREERPEAGNFVDADFDGTDLQHLNPFLVGSLLDNVTPALKAVIDDAANKGILMAVRR